MREDTLGGCGKEAMLTDFLSVFSPTPFATLLAIVFSGGTVGAVTVCCGVFGRGMVAFEGIRSLEGVCGADGMRAVELELLASCEGRLFRVLDMGNGGRAVVGGSKGGNEGDPRAVVAIVIADSRR